MTVAELIEDEILYKKLERVFDKHLKIHKFNHASQDCKDIIKFSALALGIIADKKSYSNIVWVFQESLRMAIDAPKKIRG